MSKTISRRTALNILRRIYVLRLHRVLLTFGTACLLPWFASTAALAAVGGMPSTFSNHMVLQCEKPLPIWGSAAAGEVVTVEFAGQKKSVQADEKNPANPVNPFHLARGNSAAFIR